MIINMDFYIQGKTIVEGYKLLLIYSSSFSIPDFRFAVVGRLTRSQAQVPHISELILSCGCDDFL